MMTKLFFVEKYLVSALCYFKGVYPFEISKNKYIF